MAEDAGASSMTGLKPRKGVKFAEVQEEQHVLNGKTVVTKTQRSAGMKSGRLGASDALGGSGRVHLHFWPSCAGGGCAQSADTCTGFGGVQQVWCKGRGSRGQHMHKPGPEGSCINIPYVHCSCERGRRQVPCVQHPVCVRVCVCVCVRARMWLAGVSCWGRARALAFSGGFSCVSTTVTCNVFRPSGHHQCNKSP